MSAITIHVGGIRNDRSHIAAQPPTGYGVRALCGASWREGNYSIRQSGTHFDVLLCKRCAAVSVPVEPEEKKP